EVNQEASEQTITVKSQERRFFCTSVPTQSSVDIGIVPIAGAIVPIFTPTTRVVGARHWTECSELDAQGLLSNSKLVLPERAA
ncbi:hypothetical protein, partial [Rubrivivax gelatinosus]|uniref:hypothetical protein n=1 Tax=Rubrivivax gelatinosus TaxID=28068 RepID=UPI001A915FB5